MSNAQAAPITENGVPPAAHEYVIEEAPAFKVFVGNLAYSTTDEGLETFFAPVKSDIIAKQVIMRGHKPAGYGFVTMSSAEAAQKAVELLDSQELDGRPVIVQIAKPAEQKDREKKEKKAKRRPNRRGAKAVPGEVTDAEANSDVKTEDATSAVAAALDTDEAAKPKKRKKKNNRKFNRKAAAPVEDYEALETEGAPDAAPTTAPATKRHPRIRRPRTRPIGQDPDGEPSKNMLFVANLGFNVDDEGLSKLFTDAGISVVSARVVRRRWGSPRKSKGYGFVDVGNEEEQTKAMAALQGKEVSNRSIAVKIAVNSTSTPQEADAGAADTAA